MSTTTSSSLSAADPPLLTTDATSKSPPYQNFGSIGLGYAIAIAFGFLVLLSSILLIFYMCLRYAAFRRRRAINHNQPSSPDNGIYVPRIVFVTEDDNSEDDVIVGLDQAAINSYPKVVFSKKNCGNGIVCAICLCEYKDSEMLRMLPDCKHYFHVMCVDAWLKLNASCPVCRNSPLPTPMSTPLSEVVPLSQYSDGRRRS
ncbi:RING-H2 finger ATL67-like [Olea europaea subsp. europaea]|uniref:RING-H2 finger ATL67-like n=1 Tax=Olea europaea subsp. europaea TaxID=158383 RepID=A0A8S0TLK4_OLEEU|nr:RING-H2 finger ATL67-like [Olea europaea subsp. europaea]